MSNSSIKPDGMRHDLALIASLVPEGAKVLDIGCGRGDLLDHLNRTKRIEGRGIELNSSEVSQAVARGLAVIQGDADRDLRHYPDRCFDYAILAQTLQATKQPRKVLDELLRIAHRVILTVPNFGHWRNRLYLLAKGRMPVTSQLSYEWYETPNIHFCTIRDFLALAAELGCIVERRMYLSESGTPHAIASPSNLTWANLQGTVGLFVMRAP